MSDRNGIVIHVTSSDGDDWRTALRNVSNLYREDSVSTPPDLMRVVVNGGAVRFLLSGSPEADRIETMVDAGVRVAACSSSLARLGYDPADLTDGVATVPSGVAAVASAQNRGETYLKLP